MPHLDTILNKKNIHRVKRLFYLLLLSASLTLFAKDAFSRDINLDLIYLKGNTILTNKLFESKLEAYQKSNARLIDRNVIFADWINGFEVLYLKETGTTTIAYIYHRKKGTLSELFRTDGTVTLARIGFGGRYLFIKRISLGKKTTPEGDGFCYDILEKKKITLPGHYPFLDFTISPSGNSIFAENNSGIGEFNISVKTWNPVLKKDRYEDISIAGFPAVAYPSPNRKKVLVLCGSGGSYRAKLFIGQKSVKIDDITSPSEFFWVSNNEFVYRRGSPGNFSVTLYNTITSSTNTLSIDSLHTSINYSPYAKMLSFLKDQVIHLYNVREKKLYNTGLEGDDVYFSPDGNKFVSLLSGRLFLTSIPVLFRTQRDLQKLHASIADLYDKALTEKNLWENEYSPLYIKRKISIYRQMSRYD